MGPGFGRGAPVGRNGHRDGEPEACIASVRPVNAWQTYWQSMVGVGTVGIPGGAFPAGAAPAFTRETADLEIESCTAQSSPTNSA